MTQKITLTPEEKKALLKAKTQLLTDQNATPSANSRSSKIISDIATKYKVDIQVIYDMAPKVNGL